MRLVEHLKISLKCTLGKTKLQFQTYRENISKCTFPIYSIFKKKKTLKSLETERRKTSCKKTGCFYESSQFYKNKHFKLHKHREDFVLLVDC